MSASVKVTWRGKQAINKMHDAKNSALFEGAEYLLEQANRTVPHDTGDLESSGEVSVDTRNSEASVSYGDDHAGGVDYAIYVHEAPASWRFQQGRRRKWLELTLQEQAIHIRNIIVSRIRRELK